MTTLPISQSDTLPDWYEPFPEPRTLPGGWDLSDLLAAARAALREDANGRGEGDQATEAEA